MCQHFFYNRQARTVGAVRTEGVFSCFFGVDEGNYDPDLLFTKYDELDAFLLDRNKKGNKSGRENRN